MSTQKSAVANNEKLFPIFSKRLSTLDSTSYATAAQKLAVWCSVEKAYYSAARPKIVDILETARTTLQRELPQAFAAGTICQTDCPPDKVACIEGYVKLLGTAAKFFHLFTERDLQERLHSLLLTVGIDSASLPAPVKKSASPTSSTPQRLHAPSPTSTSPAQVTPLSSSANLAASQVASRIIPLPSSVISTQAPAARSSPLTSKPLSTQAIYVPSNHASPTTPMSTLSRASVPHSALPVQPAAPQSIPEPALRVAEASSLPGPGSRPDSPSTMPIIQGQSHLPSQPQRRSSSSTSLEPKGWRPDLPASPVQALAPHAPMPHATHATNPNVNSMYTNNTRVTPTSTTFVSSRPFITIGDIYKLYNARRNGISSSSSNVLVSSSSPTASSPVPAAAGGSVLPSRRVTLPHIPAAGPAAASSPAAGPSSAQNAAHPPPRALSATMPAPSVPSTSAPAAPPPKKKKRTHAPLDFMALDLQSYLQDKERLGSAGTSTPTSPAFAEARATSAAATTPAPSGSAAAPAPSGSAVAPAPSGSSVAPSSDEPKAAPPPESSPAAPVPSASGEAPASPAAAHVAENTISTTVPPPSTSVADLQAEPTPVASTLKAPSPEAAAPEEPAASALKTTPEPARMEVDSVPQPAPVASPSTETAAAPAPATPVADAASGPSTSTAAPALPESSGDQVPAAPDVPSSAPATEALPKEVTSSQRPFRRRQIARKSTGGWPPRPVTYPPSGPVDSDSDLDSDSPHEKKSEKEEPKIEEVPKQNPPKRVRATARKSTGIKFLPKTRSPMDASPSRPKDASHGTSAAGKKPSPPKVRLKIKVPAAAPPEMDAPTFAAALDKAVGLSPARKRARKPRPAASPKNIESESPSPSPPPEAGASGASATPEASPMRDLRAEMRARRDAIGGGSARKKGRELKILSREPSGGAKAKTPLKVEAGGEDPFVVAAPVREPERMDVDGVGAGGQPARATSKGKTPQASAPASAALGPGGRVQAPPIQVVASGDGSMDMDVDESSASVEPSVKSDRMADASAARTSSQRPASTVCAGSTAESRPSTPGGVDVHAPVPTFAFTPSPARNEIASAAAASANGTSDVAANPRKRLRSRSRSPTEESRSSRRRSESLQVLPPSISQSVEAAVPPTFSASNGHFNPWLPVKDEEASDEEENYDELGSIFTSQMRVIDGSAGRAGSSTFSLRCILAEEEFSLLSRWINARNSREDVSQTMCISLACYSAKEMASARASMGNPEAWEPVLKSCHPSPWPAHGILYANVNDKISLLLARPMKVVENLVDISYLMQEGQNTLQISHDQDATDYVFFLIAHHPVRAQLKELASARQEDDAWARYIENTTKPLQSATKGWEHFMVY